MLPARILLTAPSSGSGKTLITCGLLHALKNRGKKVISFKCGPDYIDPMFHSMILGTKSRNLDTFFADEDTVRYLFEKNSNGYDLAVLEGVMGYYDGLGGISTRSSAYEVAQVTDTPVILCVDGKGSSVSLVALIKATNDTLEPFPSTHKITGVSVTCATSYALDRVLMPPNPS